MKPSIELTSRCNLNCQMCPFRIDNKNIPKGDMDWDLFTKLADELAQQSEAIMLFNRGEPFLYPKIYEAIDYVKCKVIISTNGTLIGYDKFYDTRGEKLLCVSLPAGNRETYKKITGFDYFDRVKKNIIELQEKKPENVEMYVKIVRQKENEGHEEEIKKWCKVPVMAVEDSNQPNHHGYETCSQPDITPVWDFTGKKKVCCRDEFGKYDWETYYEQAKKRELPICKNCGIC